MKKKIKLYIVEELEPYEPSYTIGIFSKLSNAKKLVKKLEKENESQFSFYDIREREIEDMYEEEN